MTAPQGLTTTQTIGPFPHEAWDWAVQASTAPQSTAPTAMLTLRGTLLDGPGAPVDDGWVEAFVPGADEPASTMPGFRRVPTGPDGGFTLTLPVPAAGQPLAWITVFARGLLAHQFTAVWRADDPAAATSAPLAQVPTERRATLLAAPADGGYSWTIRLQDTPDGGAETVFFDPA
jgi:protocatechuate 3,4-dioxygenase, alpha subunit